MTSEHFDAVIVGAGFAGIGAAIQLKRMGYENFVILDREDDLGGTWHVNPHPMHLAIDGVYSTNPEHAQWNIDNARPWSFCYGGYGDVCEYECAPGYIKQGVHKLQFYNDLSQQTPEWSGGACVPVDPQDCSAALGVQTVCEAIAGCSWSTPGSCVNTDECSSSPCQNGGNCVDGLDEYECQCLGDWEGLECHECPAAAEPCTGMGR